MTKPVFSWWVTYVIKKRFSILKKVKSKYWQRTHKYGIKIQKFVKEAYMINTDNRNNYSRYSIKQEMDKYRVGLKERNVAPENLFIFQEITT